jgi:hypothetical protein
MITFIRGLLLGMVSAFSFPVAPLYRYPYYFPSEAFRGDWTRINKDVELALSEAYNMDAKETPDE